MMTWTDERLGERFTPPERMRQMVAAGLLGRKTGQGFYTWVDGKPHKRVLQKGGKAEPVPEDLEDRLILALVNESLAVLRERLVDDADLIDAGAIFGAGFAPFRGGPLAYARSLGRETLRARLDALATQHGPRFAADAGIDVIS